MAEDTPPYDGTFVKNSFIEERSHSWQAHLKRISSYLVNAKSWWNKTDNGFIFKDGDSDIDIHPEGPFLCHFRSSSLLNIEANTNWAKILQDNIELLFKIV